MGFLSRLPNDNEAVPVKKENPWLKTSGCTDEFALILGGVAKKCAKCQRLTRVGHLDSEQLCPDCR